MKDTEIKQVKCLLDNHRILVKNKIYKVYSTSNGGIMVYTDTGFAGIPKGFYVECH
jgi:hypothetical protein